ncbi:MAG: hypothetical protein M3405_14030 [Acidobacteriota bacterium]|jgi:hypothetical protein|nr:hypothetical protein [Acidobacteriota bacterium]
MSKESFERLTESIRQAGKIVRSEMDASREFVIEIDEDLQKGLESTKIWAINVSDEDDSLILRKVYEIEFFSGLSNVKVIDEDGEVLLCPKDWFLPITIPQIMSETLARVA